MDIWEKAFLHNLYQNVVPHETFHLMRDRLFKGMPELVVGKILFYIIGPGLAGAGERLDVVDRDINNAYRSVCHCEINDTHCEKEGCDAVCISGKYDDIYIRCDDFHFSEYCDDKFYCDKHCRSLTDLFNDDNDDFMDIYICNDCKIISCQIEGCTVKGIESSHDGEIRSHSGDILYFSDCYKKYGCDIQYLCQNHATEMSLHQISCEDISYMICPNCVNRYSEEGWRRK